MGKKASVDIETMGLEPAGVAVLSVAAVMFDDGGTYANAAEVGFWRLDPRLVPGHRDEETLKWWEKQDPAVRAEAFGGTQAPWDFCRDFFRWFDFNNPDEVWANPARFDIGHLRQLFHAMGTPFPINYKKERDLPTLKALARAKAESRGAGELESLDEAIKAVYGTNLAEHSALADAIEQAEMIRMLTNYVKRP